MNKTFGTFSKGIATGIAVGTAVSMIARPMDIRKRARMKKNAARTIRAIGEVVSNVQNIVR
ncbi:MAG TPA: hypothetical protein VHO66_04490 [Ruminiclostridium sp.]|nr:hypothetical protein [Ruminiclostridium sp.]